MRKIIAFLMIMFLLTAIPFKGYKSVLDYGYAKAEEVASETVSSALTHTLNQFFYN